MRHDPIRSTNMENRQTGYRAGDTSVGEAGAAGIRHSMSPRPVETLDTRPLFVVPLIMNCRASATRRACARTFPVSDMEAANR